MLSFSGAVNVANGALFFPSGNSTSGQIDGQLRLDPIPASNATTLSTNGRRWSAAASFTAYRPENPQRRARE
ncbi:hypothetical protein [Tunturiibacter gelidiferens]|uniref:hypothetical protein n=1 Tax=Tunturiibacter gelidiferens TaxID=3069689 RepID=UPI003D9AEAAF